MHSLHDRRLCKDAIRSPGILCMRTWSKAASNSAVSLEKIPFFTQNHSSQLAQGTSLPMGMTLAGVAQLLETGFLPLKLQATDDPGQPLTPSTLCMRSEVWAQAQTLNYYTCGSPATGMVLT